MIEVQLLNYELQISLPDCFVAAEVAGQLGLRGVASALGGLDHPGDFKALVCCLVTQFMPRARTLG